MCKLNNIYFYQPQNKAKLINQLFVFCWVNLLNIPKRYFVFKVSISEETISVINGDCQVRWYNKIVLLLLLKHYKCLFVRKCIRTNDNSTWHVKTVRCIVKLLKTFSWRGYRPILINSHWWLNWNHRRIPSWFIFVDLLPIKFYLYHTANASVFIPIFFCCSNITIYFFYCL